MAAAQTIGRWRRRRAPVRRMAGVAVIYLLLLVVSLAFLIPFYWVIITSLKEQGRVFTEPPEWLPNPIVWRNYVEAFDKTTFPFLLFLRNTLFYAVLSTLGVALSSAVVAYGFARIEFTGRDTLFGITLATMMLPGVVTFIPTYILFRWLGWVGGFAPLIVPACFGGAFFIFLLRQFFMNIPWELTDAAHVDGAGEFRILTRVMLPLVKPGLLIVSVFNFMWAWNDFFGPLIYLGDVEQYTLVLGLSAFRNRFGVNWNLMMAASFATTMPLLILFFIAQRYFIEGVTLTGLKG